MSETHFVGKVAQKAIIEKEGMVLIVRDVREPRIWELPGGRLNEGEIPFEGLEREVQEELGVAIEVHEVIHGEQLTTSPQSGPHLFLVYRASLRNLGKEFVLQETEVAEVRWITKDQLGSQEIHPLYRRALEVFFAQRDR